MRLLYNGLSTSVETPLWSRTAWVYWVSSSDTCVVDDYIYICEEDLHLFEMFFDMVESTISEILSSRIRALPEFSLVCDMYCDMECIFTDVQSWWSEKPVYPVSKYWVQEVRCSDSYAFVFYESETLRYLGAYKDKCECQNISAEFARIFMQIHKLIDFTACTDLWRR